MKLTVNLETVPDREGWVAEIWQGNEMIAEVNRGDDGQLQLEVYPVKGNSFLRVDLSQFDSALRDAIKRIRERDK